MVRCSDGPSFLPPLLLRIQPEIAARRIRSRFGGLGERSATDDAAAKDSASFQGRDGAKENTDEKPAEKPSAEVFGKVRSSRQGGSRLGRKEREVRRNKHRLLTRRSLGAREVETAQRGNQAGIAKRQIGDTWARWQSYAAGRVNASAGKYTGSELTGNCRLSWYDHLMRNVLSAPAEAERFTRELHQGALGGRDGFAYLLAIAAQKMDLSVRKPKTYPEVDFARAGVGDSQASDRRRQRGLRRRAGAADEIADSRFGNQHLSGFRRPKQRRPYAERSLSPAAGCAIRSK